MHQLDICTMQDNTLCVHIFIVIQLVVVVLVVVMNQLKKGEPQFYCFHVCDARCFFLPDQYARIEQAVI